ncbi:MAG TPA: SAM-dependent methyltransferase [Trebonia sp.]|nr:SAM-dependent methyltransferase [Trebonia sp.]
MADFDPTVPSIARVYDYLLGGKDNFAVDREVAEKLLAVVPISADVMRENRQFLARAARWAAGQGITQFIDLGCGMPTVPNTHGSAQAVTAGARVAYVDNDAVVLAHLRALAAQGHPGVTVVEADVREVAATLDAVAAGVDRSAPVCLLMGALLHFFPADAARDLVAGYVTALAPGSYVVLSVGRGDGDVADQGVRTYSSGGNQSYNHSAADFAGFFGDLALVPPGIVDARAWHPDPGQEGPFPPRSGHTIVGVARVG